MKGIGGAKQCDTECQLFTTMVGTRMGDWMEKLKVNVSARFVIMKNCPVPILLGINSMSDCGIHNWPTAKMTSVGSAGTIPHLPWSEVRAKIPIRFRRSERFKGTYAVVAPTPPQGFYDASPSTELVDSDSESSEAGTAKLAGSPHSPAFSACTLATDEPACESSDSDPEAEVILVA